jgi:hypothetical protein
MQWWQPCLIFAILGGGALLFYRHREEQNLLTGEPLAVEAFRRANPGLTIAPADKSSGMYAVRDAAGSLTAYAEFQDGVPAAAASLSRTGKTSDSALPEWIPRYPGARSPVYLEWRDAAGLHTEVTFITDDRPQKVFDFFKAETEDAGWDGRAITGTGDPKPGFELNAYRASLGCSDGERGRRLNVYIHWRRPGPTAFAIAFKRGTCGAAQAGQAECPEERK